MLQNEFQKLNWLPLSDRINQQCILSTYKLLSNLSMMYVQIMLINFFNCYLAAPLPTLGHSPGGQPHQADVNHCILAISTWRSPRALQGCGSLLSPVEECLVVFEPATFRFYSQCLNPLDHSPRIISVGSEANTPIMLAKQLLIKTCFHFGNLEMEQIAIAHNL